MPPRVDGTAGTTNQVVARLQDTPTIGLPFFEMTLPCEPSRVEFVRRACTAWARRHCRLPEHQVDVLDLVVSELCTNALLYGREDAFAVRGWMPTHSWVRLEVNDRTPSAIPVPQHVGSESVSGRGLCLVDALVSELKGTWGFSADGSVAWCQVPTVLPCFDVTVEETDV
ncbi:ATP-binding protein [Streptomyces thermodiastaticus]